MLEQTLLLTSFRRLRRAPYKSTINLSSKNETELQSEQLQTFHFKCCLAETFHCVLDQFSIIYVLLTKNEKKKLTFKVDNPHQNNCKLLFQTKNKLIPRVFIWQSKSKTLTHPTTHEIGCAFIIKDREFWKKHYTPTHNQHSPSVEKIKLTKAAQITEVSQDIRFYKSPTKVI